MFFCPILKDELKARANAVSFLKEVVVLVIQEVLKTVANEHQVQYHILVLRVVSSTTYHISNILRVEGDESVIDVPASLTNHVCKEDTLDLVE